MPMFERLKASFRGKKGKDGAAGAVKVAAEPAKEVESSKRVGKRAVVGPRSTGSTTRLPAAVPAPVVIVCHRSRSLAKHLVRLAEATTLRLLTRCFYSFGVALALQVRQRHAEL